MNFALFAAATLTFATASALEAPLIDDAYVDNGTSGTPVPNNTNYGKAGILRVYQNGTRVMRSLIRFDVSSAVVPPGAISSQVSQATLRLWVNDAGGTIASFKIARLTAPWDETTLKNNTSPFPTWSTATETTVTSAGVAEGEYLDIDLTAWVKAWMDGTPNYGMILFPLSGTTVDMRFDTKESLDTAHVMTG
jgi:hypothetical protein